VIIEVSACEHKKIACE